MITIPMPFLSGSWRGRHSSKPCATSLKTVLQTKLRARAVEWNKSKHQLVESHQKHRHFRNSPRCSNHSRCRIEWNKNNAPIVKGLLTWKWPIATFLNAQKSKIGPSRHRLLISWRKSRQIGGRFIWELATPALPIATNKENIADLFQN